MTNLVDRVEVGDFFHYSWGYEQTNAEFYQVVAKTPKSVKVRRVETVRDETRPGGGQSMQEYVLPVKDAWAKHDDKVYTKRLKEKYDGTNVMFVMDYGFGYLWDGKSKRASYYA